MTTWKWFGLWVAFPSILLILSVNLALKDRIETDPQKRISDALASGNWVKAKTEYRKLIEDDFRVLEWHRGYIRAHLQQPRIQGKRHRRDDGPILGEYRDYSGSTDPAVSDIGFYGLGFFHSLEGAYPQAIEHLDKVRNRSLPFLNNSVGYAHQRLGRSHRAEEYFRREIALEGNVEGATSNLARLLHATGRFDELDRMASDPASRQAMDRDILRHLNLREGRYLQYARTALAIRQVTPFGFAGAALVFLVWFLYLRRIDLFERERVSHAGLMVVAAMVSSLGAIPLYDLLEFGFGLTLTGGLLNDFLFCIFGIGVVEEAIKMVPVLLVMRCTSALNESLDYLVYGSLSGLGFAFMENLIYFDDSGLRTIAARGFSAAILHMMLTAMVMYGLFYGRYSGKRHPGVYAFLGFAGACVVHGVYDFWIVAEGWAGQLSMISVLILIVVIGKYGRALNIAMNLSEHMPSRNEPLLNLTRWLCAWLAGIVMLQYLVLGVKYGAANANINLLSSVMSSYVLILVILGSLGRFTITKGKWLPLFTKQP